MRSHYGQSSPVLRGAWVLDTLLGTPVPPPPPDVPPLEAAAKNDPKPPCARCSPAPCRPRLRHLSQPDGPHRLRPGKFRLDGPLARHRIRRPAVDASGALPSGEKFSGSGTLRQLLLGQKDDFIRHVTAKTLGYALGRSLQDGDSAPSNGLVDKRRKGRVSGADADPGNRR